MLQTLCSECIAYIPYLSEYNLCDCIRDVFQKSFSLLLVGNYAVLDVDNTIVGK